MKKTIQQQCKIDTDHLLSRYDLLAEYAAEMSQLQETCVQHLSTLPPRLQQVGKILLQRYTEHRRRIEWAQPLVLSTAWSLPKASRQKIAVANALTAMHAYIYREATDDISQYNGDLLPLGSLLYTHTLHQYQQLFAPTSYFWRLLEGYYLEWAEAVLWERQRRWGLVKRYSQEDTLRQAGVRALLKISGAAIALLTGNQQHITPLSSALDQTHVALQLVDGLINWREDMRARRATYFLTEVALTLKAREMTSLDQLNLEKLLVNSTAPCRVIKRAMKHLLAAKKVAARLNAPALATCLDKFYSICQETPCQ
jgi:hypothetical protein